jgi:hypothetical protein
LTWPPPESERWDPHRVEADLPPVVELARRARERPLPEDARALPPVAGHGDLSGHNTRRWPPAETGGAGQPVLPRLGRHRRRAWRAFG